MSSTSRIKKLELIIQLLKRKNYCTATEIIDYLEYQEEQLKNRSEDYHFASSLRTLQRDFKEIWESFNIQIAYSRKDKGYYIVNKEDIDTRDYTRVFELNELTSLLNASNTMMEYISLENKYPLGLEHINVLLNAIKKKIVLNIKHKAFRSENAIQKIIHPILLKEFQDRWYCIALDEKDSVIKSFGLDRIEEIALTDKKFSENLRKEVEEMYDSAYGISASQGQKAEEILLKVTIHQSNYIKSLPLHHSQEIISEDKSKDACILKLKIVPSYEFISELLKMGSQVEVLQPKHLRKTVVAELQKTLLSYSS